MSHSLQEWMDWFENGPPDPACECGEVFCVWPDCAPKVYTRPLLVDPNGKPLTDAVQTVRVEGWKKRNEPQSRETDPQRRTIEDPT